MFYRSLSVLPILHCNIVSSVIGQGDTLLSRAWIWEQREGRRDRDRTGQGLPSQTGLGQDRGLLPPAQATTRAVLLSRSGRRTILVHDILIEILCYAPEVFHGRVLYSRPPIYNVERTIYTWGTTGWVWCDRGFEKWDIEDHLWTTTGVISCAHGITYDGYIYGDWRVKLICRISNEKIFFLNLN